MIHKSSGFLCKATSALVYVGLRLLCVFSTTAAVEETVAIVMLENCSQLSNVMFRWQLDKGGAAPQALFLVIIIFSLLFY